jgi:hypothetical protein
VESFFVKIKGVFHSFFNAMGSINVAIVLMSQIHVLLNGQTVLLTDDGIHTLQIITFQKLKGFPT